MPVARHLLVASLSLFAAAAGAAQTHYAWVGTYNPNGEGLYRFTVDAKTGALRDKTLVSSLPNVAQLTVSRDGKTLYAASEVEKGVVQAWRIEKNGELTALNQVASGGAGPVYLSLTPDGKHLLVANYVSGSIAVLRCKKMVAWLRRWTGIRMKARQAPNARRRPSRAASPSAITTARMPI